MICAKPPQESEFVGRKILFYRYCLVSPDFTIQKNANTYCTVDLNEKIQLEAMLSHATVSYAKSLSVDEQLYGFASSI